MDINELTNEGLQSFLCDKFFVTGLNTLLMDAV